MAERSGRRLVVFVTLAVLTVGSASARVAGHVAASVEPPPTTTAPTEPEPTVPEPTVPEPSVPETTAAAGALKEDSDVSTVTIVGLFAFAMLLVVAGWWMVSRRDEDDEPHPPPPGLDEPLPGQDLL